MIVNYELEWLNPSTESYEYIELQCTVSYSEDVGTNRNIVYAYELLSCEDGEGKDWSDMLSENDVLAIKRKVMYASVE